MKYLALLAAWGVFVVAVLLSLPAPAAAGGVIGSGPGTCTPTELYNKIAGGGGLFTFNCGGPATIVLTASLIITRDTTLDGGGVITISGGGTLGVFILNGAGLKLDNLTIADGYTIEGGAGIVAVSLEPVTLSNTNFVDNQAVKEGGAIFSNGQLTVTGGLFYSNTANLGGAIYNVGQAAISSATILSNTSGASGGAIENASGGIMAITLSTLRGNIAQGPGGAIHNLGILSLAQDTLANNSAQAGNPGGGLADFGTFANINSSTFSGNTAFGGGGMVLSDTQVYLEDTTFSANRAIGGAGALVETGQVSVDNVTFYQNTALAGSAIVVSAGPVYVENSILAGNPGNNCAGVITSQGYNIDDGNSCGLASTGDMTTTNPLLGPLANNGGPTLTHALLPGSPAIHHGNRPYCQGLDQRGYWRGVFCDIGAFQVVYRVLEPLVRR